MTAMVVNGPPSPPSDEELLPQSDELLLQSDELPQSELPP